jgi:hypothetical protein
MGAWRRVAAADLTAQYRHLLREVGIAHTTIAGLFADDITRGGRCFIKYDGRTSSWSSNWAPRCTSVTSAVGVGKVVSSDHRRSVVSLYCRGMSEQRWWTLDFDVRDDAPSVFVPAELLPDALVGDDVTISSRQPAAVRRRRISAQLDDDKRGRFFTVSLD